MGNPPGGFLPVTRGAGTLTRAPGNKRSGRRRSGD